MIVDDCFYHGDVLNAAPGDAKGDCRNTRDDAERRIDKCDEGRDIRSDCGMIRRKRVIDAVRNQRCDVENRKRPRLLINQAGEDDRSGGNCGSEAKRHERAARPPADPRGRENRNANVEAELGRRGGERVEGPIRPQVMEIMFDRHRSYTLVDSGSLASADASRKTRTNLAAPAGNRQSARRN